jgi:hypothetical protein
MLVIGGPESPIEVRGLAKYPSHGGSQGFKSPHLHPTNALVTGLAGHLRRAGVLLEPLPGQQMGSNYERFGQPPLEARPRCVSSLDRRPGTSLCPLKTVMMPGRLF